MSQYSRLGPYMDPSVFRSTTTSAYHVELDPSSPRYATNAWSARDHDTFPGELRDEYFYPQPSAYSYRSDRHCYGQHNGSSRDVDNLIRKTNQNVDLTNGAIDRVTHNTLIQPKVCSDGQYPLSFPMPMALSELMRLPESQLNRLLEEYELSLYRQNGHGASRDGLVNKLSELLDFLGARQIADVLRSGSGVNMSSQRYSLNGSRR